MSMEAWQKNWDQLGKDDPLWVVLTDPNKAGGRWDPEEFFQTGRSEISEVLAMVTSKYPDFSKNRALDFGCGVGRLSQALAEHFDSVLGIDISPSMIEHAKRFNRFPEKCQFQVNSAPDLAFLSSDSFDFVYSNIALQHIEPKYSTRYLEDFFRVLRPGGICVFQITSTEFPRNLAPAFLVNWVRKRRARGGPYIPMFGVPESKVREIITRQGGKVFKHDTHMVTRFFRGHRFLVKKK